MESLYHRASPVRCALATTCAIALLWFSANLFGATGASSVFSVSQLQQIVAAKGQTNLSFRLEARVCAVLPESRLLVLQDESAAVLMRVPVLDAHISMGDAVAVMGENCCLSRVAFGIEAGTGPTVDNDGNHPMILKRGTAFLKPGFQPIRLGWYNGEGSMGLKVEYEGPGIRRQKVPASVLWQQAGSGFEPGLHYAEYLGQAWFRLPDFSLLTPAAEGTSADFDIAHRSRDNNSALLFRGYISITNSGIYTFYLDSDDGSQLFVGDPAGDCRITRLESRSVPELEKAEGREASQSPHRWGEFEGVVTFVGKSGRGLELELSHGGEQIQATIVDSGSLRAADILHRFVRGSGIYEPARDTEPRRTAWLIVPGPQQIEVADGSQNQDREMKDTVLTTAEQIMRLKRDEARLGIKAKISGVVTWASANALVLQDATAGIYVHLYAREWSRQPKVGDLWEIEGKTDPGDFSPVIRAERGRVLGSGPMPEPMHPTWDQLMNGSLDAQYVEIKGVVTSIAEQEMTVLTADGKLRIRGSPSRPIPCNRMDTTENCAPTSELLMAGPQSFLDSVVRMRGCLTVEWDPSTRQLQAGEIFLSPAIVSVEQTAPKEPFSIRRRRASDLLLFDVRASALQRTRIGGQVIHAGTRELYLLDGEIGVRVFTREPFTLALGDMIETVGFPQLGGPTPVLREALVRKTGSAPLPQAIRVSADDLVNGRHRSRLVELEALLVNDTSRRGERTLELQSGSRHFTARLKAQPGKQAALSPGSRLAVMGVCAIGPADRLADSLNSFELLLESPAAVRVLKQPPWLTPQRALAIAGALAGGLIAALVWVSLLRRKVEERTRQLQKQIEARQRVEQRRVMEEERTRVAQDLHDELGAGLTEVSILGSLAKNPSIPAEKKDQYLDQLTDAARTLITELDEIVWAVNPHYDSVGSLASYYSLFAQRFLNLAGIACRLEIADRFPDYPLDSRLRHGIFLAFKEALNNIVRHSGATEVELKIETAEDFLVICVHDNGCGLLTDSRTPGHDGIASMHLRLKKLGGSCRLSSSPGAGARVEFRLPLNQPESMPATGSLS